MSDTPKINDLQVVVVNEFQRAGSDRIRNRLIVGNEYTSYEVAFWMSTGFYSAEIMRWNGTAWEYAAPTIYPPQ